MDLAPEVWRADLLRGGLLEVPVDGQIGIDATVLAGLHGDPADRMIVATAISVGAQLATADQRLLDWSGDLPRLDALRVRIVDCRVVVRRHLRGIGDNAVVDGKAVPTRRANCAGAMVVKYRDAGRTLSEVIQLNRVAIGPAQC